MTHPTTPQAKPVATGDHPDDCVCEECDFARAGLEDCGDPDDDALEVHDIEGLGDDDSFADSEADEPDDVARLFGPARPDPEEIQDEHVAYRAPGLLGKLFPPLFHGDWPVPFVKREACRPAALGDLQVYAFECYEEGCLTHPAVKGIAVFRQQTLTAFGMQEHDGRYYRVICRDGLAITAQHSDGEMADWIDCDAPDQAMLNLMASRLRQDSGILFLDGSPHNVARALTLHLFDPDGP